MVKILEDNRWDIVYMFRYWDNNWGAWAQVISKASLLENLTSDMEDWYWAKAGGKQLRIDKNTYEQLSDIYCRQSRKCGIDISLGKDDN